MDIQEIIIIQLNEMLDFADKNDFDTLRAIVKRIDQRDMKGRILSDNLILKAKKEWLVKETEQFVSRVQKIKNPGEIEHEKSIYLNNISIRISDKSANYFVKNVNELTVENAKHLLEKITGVQFAEITSHRLARFKENFRLVNLERLSRFYADLRRTDIDSSWAVSEIQVNDPLLEELDYFIPGKESIESLIKEYDNLINYFDLLTGTDDTELIERIELKFNKEKSTMSASRKSVDNDLKQLYIHYCDIDNEKAESLRNLILYLETFNSEDGAVNYIEYKKQDFKERVQFWNKLTSDTVHKDTGNEIKAIIMEFCVSVANQKIYNTVKNVIVRFEKSGLMTQNIDMLEGIIKVIDTEMHHFSSGKSNW